MASKKPPVQSTAQFDARTAAQLERRSRSIGAPVDDAAIDRILATIDLAGTTAILAPGVDAKKLDAADAAHIKRVRWGGEVRSMLSFLKAMIRRRKLSTPQARKKLETLAKALSLSEAKGLLETEPAYEAAFKLAELAIHRLQGDLEDAKTWTNEFIAGQYLAQQYWTFTKRPKRTRKSRRHENTEGPETIRFIQAFLKELGITYEPETIIRTMTDAKGPKRYR